MICAMLALLVQDPDLSPLRESLERAAGEFVERLDRMLGEELSKLGGDAEERIRRLEQRLAWLEREKRRIRMEIFAIRWSQADAEILRELQQSGLDGAEAKQLFDDSLDAHRDGDYEVSVRGFKKIFWAFHRSRDNAARTYACISAYNVACGYSLWGKKTEALDWLEASLAMGFLRLPDDCHDSALDHMHRDTDLDNIRKLDRYQELLREYRPRE